ncbi:MAG: hypothetical protein SPL80_09090 [Bacilli bacterium]|nr:hypothetical protein [Bacilli bacterium]
MGKRKGKQFIASKRCTLANMLMGKAKAAASPDKIKRSEKTVYRRIDRKHKKRTFMPAVKRKQSFLSRL